MKTSTKLLFVLIGVIAICLAGCLDFVNYPNKGGTDVYSLTDDDLENLDDKEEKCWHIFVTYTVNGQREDEEFFLWGTEYNVALQCFAYIDDHEAEIAAKGEIGAVRAEYKETDITREADCKADTPTPSGGSKKCWLVYASIGGDSDPVKYMWSTKADAQAYARELQDMYGEYQFDVKQVDASDKASCEALNDGGSSGESCCWEFWCMYNDHTRYSVHMWATEDYMKQSVKTMQEMWGITYHYSKAAISDKSSCDSYDQKHSDQVYREDDGSGKNDKNGKLGCWIFTVWDTDTYKWCYENFMKWEVAASSKSGNASYKAASASDEQSCTGGSGGGGGDKPSDGKSCYLVKATCSGYTMYDFTMWWTEDEVKDFVNACNSNGYVASYQKTNSSDEIDCINGYHRTEKITGLDETNEVCWYYSYKFHDYTNNDHVEDANYTKSTESDIVNSFRQTHMTLEDNIRSYNWKIRSWFELRTAPNACKEY